MVLVLALIATLPGGARAEAAASIVPFRCSGTGGSAAMENSYADHAGQGACWGHFGHHTYNTGAVHRIGLVEGSLFSVEVQFSPPVEYAAPAAAILFEGSLDGATWNTLATIPYPLTGGTRQAISFSLDAGDAEAQFLRIRQPRSAAQGLSGYLDSSNFDAELTFVRPCAACLIGGSTRCSAGIMERMFDEHPCWFGGINRYDAPSFFHTYFLGLPRLLEQLSGTVTLLPWRSDDYTQNGGSRTAIDALVQVSSDGTTWETVAEISGQYGTPIVFDVVPPASEVAFVRLVAERHTGWGTHPALKHARGFIIDSRLET
ncbi:MAG TPA: hypothetical protein VGB52_04610 [Actinomycetota bacterium]